MSVKSSFSQPVFPKESQTIIEDLRNPLRPRRWQKGPMLGKGGFAHVYEATDLSTGEKQAVKIIDLATVARAKARAKLVSEISIHKTLDSPYIVKFITHFEDDSNVYIFLDLCPDKSLNELLREKHRLSEAECAGYMAQLVQGLIYLKKQRVLHRDLKLANLFLKKGRVLIGDFGLAAKLDFDFQKRLTICGTPNYISPEILDLHHLPQPAGESHHPYSYSGSRGHSYPVDVWSMGVIMFTLLTGRPPFEDVDIKQTYQRIRQNRYAFPSDVSLSCEAKNLIACMLRTNPNDRPAVEEVARHSWFTMHARAAAPVYLPVGYGAARVNPLNPPRGPRLVPPSPSGGLRSPAEVAVTGEAAMRRSVQQLPLHARFEPMPRGCVEVRSSSRTNMLGSASMNFVSSAASRSIGPGWVVSRWIDYTSKYGMGTVLVNRKAGGSSSGSSRRVLAVYFNDSSKMYADLENFEKAIYIVRYRGHPEQRLSLRIAEEEDQGHNPDMRKKLLLIRNFRSYILSDESKEGTEKGKSVLAKTTSTGAAEEEEVHLRKYLRTRQAVIFVLSNKTQHIFFLDGSEDEVVLRPGLEVSVRISLIVRNFRLIEEIKDERIRRRVDQAVALIHSLYQPHGG